MELFPDDVLPFGRPTVSAPLQCPRCGELPLGGVAGCASPHFLCRSCGHCWSFATGRWRAVDPLACPGCATRARGDCIDQLGHEFPRFGPPMLD
jgi:hypothetical protein